MITSVQVITSVVNVQRLSTCDHVQNSTVPDFNSKLISNILRDSNGKGISSWVTERIVMQIICTVHFREIKKIRGEGAHSSIAHSD